MISLFSFSFSILKPQLFLKAARLLQYRVTWLFWLWNARQLSICWYVWSNGQFPTQLGTLIEHHRYKKQQKYSRLCRLFSWKNPKSEILILLLSSERMFFQQLLLLLKSWELFQIVNKPCSSFLLMPSVELLLLRPLPLPHLHLPLYLRHHCQIQNHECHFLYSFGEQERPPPHPPLPPPRCFRHLLRHSRDISMICWRSTPARQPFTNK